MTAANEALSTNQAAAVTFDTLSAVQELRKSGFEDPQAEALVKTINKAMSETVATKADLELQDSKTRAEFAETRAEIAATRKDLEAQIGGLRAEIASMQDKIVIRLGALMVSMTFLLLAIGPFYIRWVMSLMAS